VSSLLLSWFLLQSFTILFLTLTESFKNGQIWSSASQFFLYWSFDVTNMVAGNFVQSSKNVLIKWNDFFDTFSPAKVYLLYMFSFNPLFFSFSEKE
jgi:hypothetical protein